MSRLRMPGMLEHVAQVAHPHVDPPIDPSTNIPPGFVERIVDVLHPLQIWLFGSRARGEARPDSDWDLMAILPDDAPDDDLDLCSVWTRLRDLRLQRMELFTMTRSDFEEWNRSLGTLAEIVASTGIVVYAR
jgi:predicted nucleotidyltransferase